MAGWTLPPRTMPLQDPAVLWTPDPDEARGSRIAGFARWVREHRGVDHGFPVDELDYAALHDWSVRDLDGFWSAVAEYLGVIFHDPPTATLGRARDARRPVVPRRHAELRRARAHPRPGRADDDVARRSCAREDGLERDVTHAELRDLVGRARAGPGRGRCGRRRPGRRAGPELRRDPGRVPRDGRRSAPIWSSCSPDFGAARRARPVRPDRAVGAARRRRLPLRRQALRRPRDGRGPAGGAADAAAPPCWCRTSTPRRRWTARSRGRSSPPRAAPLEFDAGAVRPPAVGALLVGHDRAAQGHRARRTAGSSSSTSRRCALQMDLGPGDRFFWFTTTGWMMWNFLIGGLLVGATVVLFDGNPGHPDLGALWAARRAAPGDLFGTSAPFLQACLKAGLRPGDAARPVRRAARSARPARRCRPSGSAGSPTPVGAHVQICSVSGGTDVCTAFLGLRPDGAGVAGRAVLRGAGRRRARLRRAGRRRPAQRRRSRGELVITAADAVDAGGVLGRPRRQPAARGLLRGLPGACGGTATGSAPPRAAPS